jgi:hypothetical protein
MGVCVIDTIELKILSSTTFAAEIEAMVKASGGSINYLDAVTEFLERNEEVEPETIASLIQRNQRLKAMIYEDAEKLRLVEKVCRLPVD